MTDQEKNATGHRLLTAFQLMFNAAAVTHHIEEQPLSEAEKLNAVHVTMSKMLLDFLNLYPRGLTAREDLKAIGEAFGIKVSLFDIDLRKASKAASN